MEYKEAIKACSDPELKAIFEKHAEDEKKHAGILLDWIKANAGMYLN